MLFVSHLQNGHVTFLIQGKYTNTHTPLPQTLSNRLLLKAYQIQKITKVYLKFRIAYFMIRKPHCFNVLLKDYHCMILFEQFEFKGVLVQHKELIINHLKPDNLSLNKDTLLRVALKFAVKIHDNIGSLSRCLSYSQTCSNIIFNRT